MSVKTRVVRVDGPDFSVRKYVPGYWRKVEVGESWFAGVHAEVRGPCTYYLRHELKVLGFRWDPRKRVWVAEKPVDEVEELLKRYGCIRVEHPTGWAMDLEAGYFATWLCPFRGKVSPPSTPSRR